MHSGLKILAVALLLATLASPAVAASPEGQWWTGPKDMRYELKFCGDGDDLCGWLVYAADQGAEAQSYVNKMILDTARSIGDQKWEGAMTLAGYQMSGTIELVEPDKLEIDACVMFVICGKFALYRA